MSFFDPVTDDPAGRVRKVGGGGREELIEEHEDCSGLLFSTTVALDKTELVLETLPFELSV